MPIRGDFIKNMKVMNPSERRFQQEEDYDLSKHLSTVKEVKTRKVDT